MDDVVSRVGEAGMRRIWCMGIIAFVPAGCSSEVEPRDLTITDIRLLPASISALAAEARAAGGHVVVGFIPAETRPAPPELDALAGDESVAYGVVEASVATTDDLGAAVESEMEVKASDGAAPALVDADGRVLPGVRIVGWEPNPYREFAVGEYVLFIVPYSSDSWFLLWRAEFSDGQVSGAGTAEIEGVGLDALRL